MAVGETLRITKNFRVGTSRFRNNELCTVTAIDRESITVGDGREIKRTGPLHLDQGVAVTSHASQGKTIGGSPENLGSGRPVGSGLTPPNNRKFRKY